LKNCFSLAIQPSVKTADPPETYLQLPTGG
jgi:hypothetical protein